ncbi:hypothetical protein Pcinc_037100 [Petrolisthes cinctipes]|uniref:Aminopeptidase n=1 Tax=Petrolisthes cinctipes TaxID=88211 RepID=A0AAE1EP71_PETCI|nr:hypothetical protein Pcinc_037100 [Petrolisthes cinctipes]
MKDALPLPPVWWRLWTERVNLFLLLLLLPASTSSSDFPDYFDELLGLSMDPHPVLFYATTNTATTNITITDSTPPLRPAPTVVPDSGSPSDLNYVEVSGMDDRLPETMRPLHYTIRVHPFIHGNETMNGVVEMELEVVKSTANITFHISQMLIVEDDMKLEAGEGDPGGTLPRITHLLGDLEKNLVSAQLEGKVEAGRRLRLTVSYVAFISGLEGGFFALNYTDEGVERKMLASLHQPWDARKAFPCLDEPHLKATFDLHVARTTNMTALSNMPLSHTTPLIGEPGWVVDTFQRTPLMSTYNLMLVVSSLHHVNFTTDTGLPIRIWTRGEKINQTSFLQRVTLGLLTFLEDYTDLPFSLPKLDIVAVPADSAVAFEGWGLIQFYTDCKITMDAEDDTQYLRSSLTILTAHELAHQWFGNLVTPHWWSEVWLSEGFATYFHHVASINELPLVEWVTEGPQTLLHMILKQDSHPNTHPLEIPITQADSMSDVFDSIGYHKGAAIIRMLNHVLTPHTFRNGLRQYLKAHQYGSVSQRDLWQSLTEAGHRDGTLSPHLDLSTIMNTWTRKAGYPVIKVVKIPRSNSATVYQERFTVNLHKKSHDLHNHKWWIPLTFTSQGSPDFNNTRVWLWMRDTDSHMRVHPLPKNQWVIFNVQQTGYYRVNYDLHNWRLLTQQLLINHTVIHVANRAQLLDDALQLALAGQLDYRVALDMTSYLAREEESQPWKSGTKGLEHIESLLKSTPAAGPLKKYLLALMVPLLSNLRFDTPKEISEIQTKHSKAVKLACRLGHKDCIHLAISLYTQWMQNRESIEGVALELREVVYCTAIAHGGSGEWNFAWSEYFLSNDKKYKHLLLRVMGCARDIDQEEEGTSVEASVGGQLRGQGVVEEQEGQQKEGLQQEGQEEGQQQEGQQKKGQQQEEQQEGQEKGKQQQRLAWNLLTKEWDRVASMLGEDEEAVEMLVMSATESFSTYQEVDELVKFLEAHRDVPGVVKGSELALHRATQTLDWRERYYGVVREWLQERGY